VAISSIPLYAALAGFNIPINLTTFLYAAIFGTLAGINMFVQQILLARINLVIFNLIINLSSLVIPTVFAFIFLGETLSWSFGIAAALILVSVFLPLHNIKDIDKSADNADQDEKTKKHNAFLLIIAIIVFIAVLGASSIVSKLAATDPNLTSQFSFFTYTNIILIGILALMILPMSLKNKADALIALKSLKSKSMIFAAITIVLGVVSNVLSYTVLQTMDLSLNQFASRAISLVFITVLSFIVFRDGLNKITAVSVILSVLAFVFLFFLKF